MSDKDMAEAGGQVVASSQLTDDQIFDFWLFRDCMDAIRAGDMRGQFISAFRVGIAAIDSRPTATKVIRNTKLDGVAGVERDAVLEEAAVLCANSDKSAHPSDLADAIRSIKSNSTVSDLGSVRNAALQEAAAICDAKFHSRSEGGFPREASAARACREEILALMYAAPVAQPLAPSGANLNIAAGLKGLAAHVRAVPEYRRLLGDMCHVDNAIAALAAQPLAASAVPEGFTEKIAAAIFHVTGHRDITNGRESLVANLIDALATMPHKEKNPSDGEIYERVSAQHAPADLQAAHAAAVYALPQEAKPAVLAASSPEEVAAFESWANSEKYEMTTHPLHWLFLNERTYAARQGWKAALRFALAAPSQQPAASPMGAK